MATYLFGSGALYGTPLTTYNGTAVVNPTPIKLGLLQEVSLDISFDIKEAYGQNQFAAAIGRGKGKVQGKAKIGLLNGATLNSLVFGQTMTNSIISDVNDTVGAVIPTTPFTITPTPPSSGVWSQDLGVVDGTGVSYTRVASAPTTGQYSVAAGVYTFAAADAAKTVFISYQYTGTSTTATTGTVANVAMGQAPTFKADFYDSFNGKPVVWTLKSCVVTKFTMATKQDDFAYPEIDFSAFADANNNVLTWAFAE